jgi:hypothetical protein
MAKLLSFLACEKPIIDKGDVPTLVAIMQGVSAALVLPEGVERPPIPRDALAPKPWSIFTIWQTEGNEIGKTFHQKNEIVLPDDLPLAQLSGDLKFVARELLNFNYVNLQGFPVGLEGKVNVVVWLENEAGAVVQAKTNYPILVKYVPAPEGSIPIPK